MRKYQPIWEAIKANNKAALSAPIENHRRIKVAVRKEKAKDSHWKALIRKEKKVMQLNTKSEGNLLIFTLVEIAPYKSKRPLTRKGNLI